MSERKVLNKYYPPDFDPAKIPRARCPRNRQFTVRLMVPCNIKCFTCGEYIAKGKKFNARKEDVENMTYLGVRIYRFYIKCPGCLAEISFRTDPESTDYVIEAGAHRNFQALKLAEEQAAREEREAKEEIESNPMLLLENRTQQSQYEMEVLESLEDLRDMNERHAGIDLGKITARYETERKMTQEQIEEAEKFEALQALGYEMIEGQMVKRIASEELQDSPAPKKSKPDSETGIKSKPIVPAEKHNGVAKKNTMKSKMMGLIKTKSDVELHAAKMMGLVKTKSDVEPHAATSTSNCSDAAAAPKFVKPSIVGKDPASAPESGKRQEVHSDSTNSSPDPLDPNLSSKIVTAVLSSKPKESEAVSEIAAPKVPNGLSFLGAYSDSDEYSN